MNNSDFSAFPLRSSWISLSLFLKLWTKGLVGFAENMAEMHEGQRIYRMCLQMDKGVHHKVIARQVYTDLKSRLPNDSEIAGDPSVLIRQ